MDTPLHFVKTVYHTVFQYIVYIYSLAIFGVIVTYLTSSSILSFLVYTYLITPLLMTIVRGEKKPPMELVKNYTTLNSLFFFILIITPILLSIIPFGILNSFFENDSLSFLLISPLVAEAYRIISPYIHQVATGTKGKKFTIKNVLLINCMLIILLSSQYFILSEIMPHWTSVIVETFAICFIQALFFCSIAATIHGCGQQKVEKHI